MTTPRDLTRLAESLSACAGRLDTRQADEVVPPEVERVRRLLLHVAGEIGRHATVLRRLDDEILLLSRRREATDDRHLAELRRRRDRSEAQVRDEIDRATRTLVPGGDALEPATILRRLAPGRPGVTHAYFGRPAVDRDERVRRISAILLRGVRGRTAARALQRTHQPRAVTTKAVRHHRLARIRQHLLRSVDPSRHTSGASS